MREDGQMVCNVLTFVDDERVVGPTEELTWQASHVLASKQSYLGIQDAARKARPCSQTTGAWAGAIVHVVEQL
jgi:ligand-binding SRPBCC domain-containing protein